MYRRSEIYGRRETETCKFVPYIEILTEVHYIGVGYIGVLLYRGQDERSNYLLCEDDVRRKVNDAPKKSFSNKATMARIFSRLKS